MKRATGQPCHSSSPTVGATLTKGLSLRRRIRCFVLAIGLAAIPANSFATLFVVSFGNGPNTGTIGAYTNSGAVINASLITGLSDPLSVAASGGFLYVTTLDGKIGKYTTSGATVNASLVTGLNQPTDIEVSGNRIFVADFGHGFDRRIHDLGSNYQLFPNRRCTFNRHRSIRHTFVCELGLRIHGHRRIHHLRGDGKSLADSEHRPVRCGGIRVKPVCLGRDRRGRCDW